MPENKDIQENRQDVPPPAEEAPSSEIAVILSEIELEDPVAASVQGQEEDSGGETEIGSPTPPQDEETAPEEGVEPSSTSPDAEEEVKEESSDVPGDKALEDAFETAISEDELWDESGDLEDIPLFQEVGKERGQEAGATGAEEETAPEAAAKDEERSQPAGGEEEDAFKRKTQVDTVTILIPDHLFPYAAGLAAFLTILAAVVIWRTASTKPSTPHPQSQNQLNYTPSPSNAKGLYDPSSGRPGKGSETLALAPFLIPAERSGELVFFKLHVELIIDNQTIKHELMRKEAWVRDIIYSELKGIDISEGVAGNVLLRYRKPIITRINKELSPLRVEDIRMVGVLLK